MAFRLKEQSTLGRAGAVRRHMALPDVLVALTACERRGDFSKLCGAGCVDPPDAAR